MAIKAGRVGVNPSDVDSHGHIRGGGGGGGSSYTKQETDALLNAKADKTTLGGLEFRNNDGAPQVKVDGEWVNFNKGGGIGFNVPNPTAENLTYRYTDYVSGGYQVDNNICYIDITVTLTVNLSGQSFIIGFPSPTKSDPKVMCYCDGVDIPAEVSTNGHLSPLSQLKGGTTYRIIGYYNV